MERVDTSPLPTLCCEMDPIMAADGRMVFYDGDGYDYSECKPLLCQYCEQQVCKACWESGKHFIKNFVIPVSRDMDGGEIWAPMKVVRDMPACINPWKNALLKVKGKL